MDFFFIQMSDPQFGMFARLSGLDEERIREFRRRQGWNILPAAKTVGFAQKRHFMKRPSQQPTVSTRHLSSFLETSWRTGTTSINWPSYAA